MFWSQITIPGKPRLLVVDGSFTTHGWDAEFCDRIFNALRRKGMGLMGDRPLHAGQPQDIEEVLYKQSDFNCMLLFCPGNSGLVAQESKLRSFWAWLSGNHGFPLTPKLLAVCTPDRHDPETSQSILAAGDSFAQFVIVPESPLSPRAAGLYFMKFFSELDLHAHDSIMGKMVWFSHAKAKELLKRRRLPGQITVRC